MEKQNSKFALCVFLVIVFSALFIFFGNKLCHPSKSANGSNEVYYTAVVTNIDENGVDKKYRSDSNEIISEDIKFTAQLKSGDSKGKSIDCIQHIDYMYAYVFDPVEIGDRVIVTSVYDFSTNDYNWQFGGYDRTLSLCLLVLLFFALIVAIGRKKGILTIISLIITALAVFLVYVPSILKGMNIYLSTIIVTGFITFATLLLLNGADKKTLSAIVGNLGGLVVSGLISAIMNAVLEISGLSDEDFVSLKLLDTGVEIDLVAVIWGGIVVGALGAIMDVAMSIASSMQELSDNMENKSFARLFKSGMNIGKDAIGTMTNTLILAYIGSSLVTVLLLVAYNKDLLYLFNLETIAIEIVQAISGSIGIICAVPLTAAFSAFIFTQKS